MGSCNNFCPVWSKCGYQHKGYCDCVQQRKFVPTDETVAELVAQAKPPEAEPSPKGREADEGFQGIFEQRHESDCPAHKDATVSCGCRTTLRAKVESLEAGMRVYREEIERQTARAEKAEARLRSQEGAVEGDGKEGGA